MHPQAVLQLLRTHAPADPTELDAIQSKAEFYDAELASWQQRLDAALILVNLLQTKVSDLGRKKEIFTSYIAPIRPLPAELLSQIFVIACEEDPDFDIFPVGRPTGFLTSHSLVHVCKFWRTVALDTRSIWHHSVNLKPLLQIDRNITDRLQSVRELYGQNLVRLYVHLASKHAWWGVDLVRDVILRSQNHVKSLKLVGKVFEGSQPEILSAPLLEELLLSADVATYELVSSVEFHSPTLTKVFLYYPPSALPRLSIPRHQLTYLSLGFPMFEYSTPVEGSMWFPLETILNFLQNCSSLLHLNFTYINISYPIQGVPPVLNPVTLPRLRTLEINDPFLRTASIVRASILPPVHQWESLITYLSAPSLKRFDWIIPERINSPTPLLYSIPSINHFLRTTRRIQIIRVAVCDFEPLAVQRTHILRICGTLGNFSTLRSTPSLANEDVLKLATQRKYPLYVSPVMIVNETASPLVHPQHCSYIDNILEGGEPGTYGPVEAVLPERLRSLHPLSRPLFEGLLGAEQGPVDCERRLYLTV
jgi:hypothetical protein